MIELLSNCSHQSEIAMYLATRPAGDKCIWKVATTSSGIANLKQELAGFEWYQEQRYPGTGEKLCRILGQKESYLKIGIRYIEGSKADFRQGLKKNEPVVRQVISHYCEIWKPTGTEKVALHGDLSLGNVLINSYGVHIIDWEHFMADSAPWGFDALYFLFETLWLGMMNKRASPTVAEIRIFRECIQQLSKTGPLDTEALRAPLRFTQEFIRSQASLWGDQLWKFPVLNFEESQVKQMDSWLSGRAA